MTGNTCKGLEDNTHARVLHMSRVLESTTPMHGLIDMQVHNYSLKCGGCYTHESGTICITLHFSSTVYYTLSHKLNMTDLL